MSPTMEFRWMKKKQLITELFWNETMVLQQKWKDRDGRFEWRDIPIEEETEQPTDLNMYDLEGRN